MRLAKLETRARFYLPEFLPEAKGGPEIGILLVYAKITSAAGQSKRAGPNGVNLSVKCWKI